MKFSITRLFFSTLLFTQTLFAGVPPISPTQSVEDEIKLLDQKWAQAYVTKDIPTLQEIMSDELVTTDATGTTFLKGKEQDIQGVRSGIVSYQEFKIQTTSVKHHGDTAISVGRFSMKGKVGEKEFSGHYAFTETWIKRNGKWQAIAEHITAIQ